MPHQVENLMTPKMKCAIVHKGDTIGVLKEQLCKKQHRMAIVVDDNDHKVVGVITVSNLEQVDDDELVDQYYSSPAYTIQPSQPIGMARREFTRISIQTGKRIHQLVVINENNEPVGILWDYVAILGCSGEKPEEKTPS